MGCPFACRAVMLGVAVAAAHPATAPAATAVTVTLNVSSTVATPPGTCLFAPVDPPAGDVPALPTASFAVMCSGPGPYFVAMDDASGILLPMPGDVVPGDPGSRAAPGHRYALPGAPAIDAPGRSILRPITAIVQY